MDEARLDRIEKKIDQLSETLVTLARVEEKLTALELDRMNKSKTIAFLDNELHNLKARVHSNADRISGMVKFGWMIAGVSTAAFLTALANKLVL